MRAERVQLERGGSSWTWRIAEAASDGQGYTGRMRYALGLLTGLFIAMGCESDTRWWCHTAEHAEAHERGRPKCYTKPEYCKGECEVKHTAYCYEAGQAMHVGDYSAPADRNCYATMDVCLEAQQVDAAATHACAPDDPG